MKSKRPGSSLVRNFTFGVEDSLASTVGLLSGIAAANVNNSTIIITGLILIFTEALSMGVGSFLTEESVAEYETKKDPLISKTLPGALVMFFSYLIAGIIPIIPYWLFSMPRSLFFSMFLSIGSLSLLGVINALVSGTSVKNSTLRMLILGGSVAIAGVVIGSLLSRI